MLHAKMSAPKTKHIKTKIQVDQKLIPKTFFAKIEIFSSWQQTESTSKMKIKKKNKFERYAKRRETSSKIFLWEFVISSAFIIFGVLKNKINRAICEGIQGAETYIVFKNIRDKNHQADDANFVGLAILTYKRIIVLSYVSRIEDSCASLHTRKN